MSLHGTNVCNITGNPFPGQSWAEYNAIIIARARVLAMTLPYDINDDINMQISFYSDSCYKFVYKFCKRLN